MKVIDIINKSPWTPDCGGKWDLDFTLLKCSTRYWRDYTAKPSFICPLYNVDGDELDYLVILELPEEEYICGESEEECKLKVRQWYRDNLLKAIEILSNMIKEETR